MYISTFNSPGSLNSDLNFSDLESEIFFLCLASFSFSSSLKSKALHEKTDLYHMYAFYQFNGTLSEVKKIKHLFKWPWKLIHVHMTQIRRHNTMAMRMLKQDCFWLSNPLSGHLLTLQLQQNHKLARSWTFSTAWEFTMTKVKSINIKNLQNWETSSELLSA